LFFAEAKRIVKKREAEFDFAGKQVSDIKKEFLRQYPAFDTIFKSVMFALNERYVSEDVLLKDGDVLAIIPPVGGG